MVNPPLPGSKLFEELVLDFDISKYDRRKLNFLMIAYYMLTETCVPENRIEFWEKLIVDRCEC